MTFKSHRPAARDSSDKGADRSAVNAYLVGGGFA